MILAAVLSAWLEYAADGTPQARALVTGACPSVTYAGGSASNTGGWNTAETAQLFSNGAATFQLSVPDEHALTLTVSSDAYGGSAEFVVLVDGRQVGGTYSTQASHADGQHEDIVVQGTFAAHPDEVSVQFVNDLYGGSAETDRNLYVEGLSVGGQAFAGGVAVNTGGWNTAGTAQLFSDGSATFHLDQAWHL